MQSFTPKNDIILRINKIENAIISLQNRANNLKTEYDNILGQITEHHLEKEKIQQQLHDYYYTYSQAFKYVLQKYNNDINVFYANYAQKNNKYELDEQRIIEEYTYVKTLEGLYIVFAHLRLQIKQYDDLLTVAKIPLSCKRIYDKIIRELFACQNQTKNLVYLIPSIYEIVVYELERFISYNLRSPPYSGYYNQEYKIVARSIDLVCKYFKSSELNEKIKQEIEQSYKNNKLPYRYYSDTLKKLNGFSKNETETIIGTYNEMIGGVIPGSAVIVPLTIDSKGRIVAASNLHL